MLYYMWMQSAISHLDIKFSEFNIDTMSITAHKFGGPKGVGILLVKTIHQSSILN